MTTNALPPEESPKPSVHMLNLALAPQRHKPLPGRCQPGLPTQRRDCLEDAIDPSAVTTRRFIAFDIGAEITSEPAMDRHSAIESLYDHLGCTGADTYTGTIVIIEITGSPHLVLSLSRLTFQAGCLPLQNYRPDPQARRRDQLAADVDESERLQ